MMFNTRTYAFCFGLLALAFHPLASIAQSSSNAFDLIPYPQTLEPGEGNFIVTAQTKTTTAPRFSREAVQLTWILQQGLGSTLPPVSTRRPAPMQSGQAILQKGLHPFKLDFIEGGGGFTLRLCYCFNGSPLGEIPDEWFRH
jgi:hypothetical protein